jgi:hypothetical protein
MDMNSKFIYSILIAVVVLSGVGIGYVIQHPNMADPDSTSTAATGGVYNLNLVITTNNYFNSTSQQPAYYVLQNGTLTSSANIALPANTLIEVTIFSYDDGNAPVPASYQNVTGTTNNQITVFNNTNVNSSETNNGIQLNGSWKTGSVPLGDIAHTFTVSGIGLNVPIPVSSIVQFSFESGNAGQSYTWQCYADCGSGASGWGQAMSTPGWMTGTISIQ